VAHRVDLTECQHGKSVDEIAHRTPGGTRATSEALDEPKDGKLSALRTMTLANGLLHVANGVAPCFATMVSSRRKTLTHAARGNHPPPTSHRPQGRSRDQRVQPEPLKSAA
jgi:hypothetical protein